MPRARNPIDPLTGEPTDPGVGSVLPSGSDHRSKAEKTVGLRIAGERLKKLCRQNEKLRLELKRDKGNLVPLEDIKRQVIAANVSVKNQVLAAIERANLPRESKLALRQEMIRALNDLAYERSSTLTNPD